MTTKISKVKKAVAAAAFGAVAMMGMASAVDAGQPQIQGAFQVALLKPMGCRIIAKGSHHRPPNPKRGVYVVNTTGVWLPAGKWVRYRLNGTNGWTKIFLPQPLAPGAKYKARTYSQTTRIPCRAFTSI